MRRIIVLGGFGFFGAAAVERFRADGVSSLIGSRRASADVQVDVEDRASIRAALRSDDLVIDVVGPFQDRTTTLVESAIEIGFDVIDISDSLSYVSKIHRLKPQIDAADIRVLTACSSVSAVSAAMVRLSGIGNPVRLTAMLAPATRYTAVPATGASLLRSIGRPILVLNDGELVTRIGWRQSRAFDMANPIGKHRGHLFESADSLTLPKIWPTLRTVDFYVDTQVVGLNAVFSLAARVQFFRRLVESFQTLGFAMSRLLGSASGVLAYEIEGADGNITSHALVASDRGYFTPIVPAVIAARAIAEDRFAERGLVPVDEQVNPYELVDYLDRIGVDYIPLGSS